MREIMKRFRRITEQKQPTDLVVVGGGHSYSYEEFWKTVSELTDILLNQCKMDTQDHVGIYMSRTADYIPAVFAVSNADGIFLPLDVKAPIERLSFIIEESGTECVITDVGNMAGLQELFEHSVTYRSFVVLFNQKKVKSDRISALTENPLLYCIYTSGSTGLPKGVELYESSLLTLIDETNKEIYRKFQGSVNVGVIAPFHFDLSLIQIYAAVLLGHVLYITDEQQRANGRSIVSFINHCNIEVIDLTPSHIELICMAMDKFEEIEQPITIISSGEELKVSTAKKVVALLGDRLDLVNYYGPTECTVETVIYHVDPVKLQTLKSMPIGKPIGGTRCYLLDENGKMLSTGEKGELYLAGKSVGKGYINRPEENSRSFLPDLLYPQEKMYKTGDIAFWGEDENIYYLGRSDSQIKLNGYRIEIGEIENVFLSMESVRLCSVIFYDGVGGKRLIGFYSAEDVEEADIKAYLTERLPEYMVPTKLICLEDFPITSNGKIDKKQLKRDYERSSVTCISGETEKNVSTKEDEIRSKVTEIYKRILRIPSENEISDSMDFFELGGDSLGVFSLICDIYETFSVELDMSKVVANSRIDEVAELIKSETVVKTVKEKRTESRKVPMTSMEKYFLVEHTYERLLLLMNCSLKKNIDRNRMAEAFEKALDSQLVVSATFLQKGESYYKFIQNNEQKRYKIHCVDDGIINDILIKENQLLHDMSVGVEIFIGETKIGLLFDHIIMDVFSGKILIRQAIEFYLGTRKMEINDEYFAYSVEQKKYFNSTEYERALPNLLDEYMHIPEFPLSGPERRQSEYSFVLGDHVKQKIEDFAATNKCTKFAFLLDVICKSMFRYFPDKNLYIGIFNEGRYKKQQEDVIGNFAYPYPIVVEADGKDTRLNEIVKKLQKRYDFKGLQLYDIFCRLPENLAMKWNELFWITVNYYNFSCEQGMYDYVQNITLRENSELIYPFVFNIEENADDYQITIQVNNDFLEALDAKQLGEEFADNLQKRIQEISKMRFN